MNAFDKIAEERIREAIEKGVFKDLPGLGERIELEDLSGLDPELRAGYLLLRGANVIPEEAQLRKETLRLADLIASCEDDAEKADLERKRSLALLRYELSLASGRGRRVPGEYRQALRNRLGR